jgi:hypothetical protein
MGIEKHKDYIEHYEATIVDFNDGFKKEYFRDVIKSRESQQMYEACAGIKDALKYCKSLKAEEDVL